MTSMIITQFFLTKQTQLYSETLQMRSETVTKSLVQHAELGVLIANKELLLSLLGKVMKDENVLFTAILNPKKRILAMDKQKALDLRLVSRLISRLDLKRPEKGVVSKLASIKELDYPAFFLMSPVVSKEKVILDEEELLFFTDMADSVGGQVIGYGLVVVSTKAIALAIKRNRTISLLITLGVIVLGIVVGLLFTSFIIKPVKALVSGTKLVSGGDYSIQVDVSSKDEIGVLTYSFNTMVDKIRVQQDQLMDYNRTLEEKVKQRTSELAVEKEKSDELLLNILPLSIADRLKAKEETIADSFDEVTVLFSDIVGFTPLSSKISATELVVLLNDIISEFDRMTERFGLEKIKTVGDAYMAVSGAPDFRSDHAECVANMALEMREFLSDYHSKTGDAISIRIGINTGPVVAGVIGLKKFVYDLWGDAVNVASRMESSGVPGEVQISESTYAHIKDKFITEDRGEIEVKGKGKMQAYLLKGTLG
ncbi:HAMP domain-containing protein [bacterium]|nr:HAMP domain-containing protein [bacterium]